MTPAKWYLLYVTGSLKRANTYVQRYKEESERVALSCSKGKKPTKRISPMASDIKIPQMVKRKVRGRSTGKKLSKSIKVTETDPANSGCSGTRIPSLCIPDSPQMLEFFAEVRQRQLRDYYLRMKAAERCSRVPAICPKRKPSQIIKLPGSQEEWRSDKI